MIVFLKQLKKFSDIKLKDYYNTTGCEDDTYNKPVVGSSTNYLFYNYIDNVKGMLEATKKYHNKLLDILDKLFVFGINPETQYKTVIINPALTDLQLKDLTTQTITIITNLYRSCEQYFSNGIQIYISIAKKQLLKTSKSQIEHLNSLHDSLGKMDNTAPTDMSYKYNEIDSIAQKPLIIQKTTDIQNVADKLKAEAIAAPQVTDIHPGYPDTLAPQVTDIHPGYPDTLAPQVTDMQPEYPDTSAPQVTDMQPGYPDTLAPQVIDMQPGYPNNLAPQVTDMQPG